MEVDNTTNKSPVIRVHGIDEEQCKKQKRDNGDSREYR